MHDATLPANVRLGPNSIITGDCLTRDRAFRLFRSRLDPGLVIGAGCTMDGVMFNAGPKARIEIGDHCHFHEATLISDLAIRVGCRVVIGWHATVIDADFHPMDAAARMADAVACSPLGWGAPRRPFERRPVVIEDDVWIGPNATILKGFRVGQRVRVLIGVYAIVISAVIVCDNLMTVDDDVLMSCDVLMIDAYRLPFGVARRCRALARVLLECPRRLAADVPTRPIRVDRVV